MVMSKLRKTDVTKLAIIIYWLPDPKKTNNEFWIPLIETKIDGK